MPIYSIHWTWEEAFDKFGFDDGDGANFTSEVATFIEDTFGYETECEQWGLHNYMIFRILDKDGKNIMPEEGIGYTSAREYLPADMVKALDEEFTDGWGV